MLCLICRFRAYLFPGFPFFFFSILRSVGFWGSEETVIADPSGRMVRTLGMHPVFLSSSFLSFLFLYCSDSFLWRFALLCFIVFYFVSLTPFLPTPSRFSVVGCWLKRWGYFAFPFSFFLSLLSFFSAGVIALRALVLFSFGVSGYGFPGVRH